MPNSSDLFRRISKTIAEEACKNHKLDTPYATIYNVPGHNNSFIEKYADAHDSIDYSPALTKCEISADTIEKSVVEILKKYKLLPDESVQQEENKTFTLDEIITIIDSIPHKLNNDDLWKSSNEELIDKHELKKKFKTL